MSKAIWNQWGLLLSSRIQYCSVNVHWAFTVGHYLCSWFAKPCPSYQHSVWWVTSREEGFQDPSETVKLLCYFYYCQEEYCYQCNLLIFIVLLYLLLFLLLLVLLHFDEIVFTMAHLDMYSSFLSYKLLWARFFLWKGAHKCNDDRNELAGTSCYYN